MSSKQTKEYNMLLLGETGVGKSTFINAFVNYMTFKTLDDAINSKDILCLIPSRFTISDKKLNEKLIVLGSDDNEDQMKVGASSTQYTRSYRFPVGNAVIRLIDTPGIGDTRGTGVDDTNFDHLLSVIGELKDIHAICILLKPNHARLTVLFEYCIKQLLTRLQRSAANNIVFIFTNARGTFYKPGDTVIPLREALKTIEEQPPYVKIPFGQGNTFSLDNEAFKFLVASRQGVDFDDTSKRNFDSSWNTSAQICQKLIEFIIKTEPHQIQDTVSINEARRLIWRLSEPLAEVTQNIDANVRILSKHKTDLSDVTLSKHDLVEKMYIPVQDLDVIKLPYPMTVCTHESCVEYITVGENHKIWYKTECHNHCYLSGVPPEVIGSEMLRNCAAMVNGSDCNCSHSYKVHMHIYYKSKISGRQIEDENIKKSAMHKDGIVQALDSTIQSLDQRKAKYEKEKVIIQNTMAKFAHFLQNNSIAAYNDKYKAYIEYLIDMEENRGNLANRTLIDSYKKSIAIYNEYKAILDQQLSQKKELDTSIIAVVTAADVKNEIELLYSLELNGPIIRDYFEKQNDSRQHEMLSSTEKTFEPLAVNPNNPGVFGRVGRWFGVKPKSKRTDIVEKD